MHGELEGAARLVVAELALAFEAGEDASEEVVGVETVVGVACPVAEVAPASDAAVEDQG